MADLRQFRRGRLKGRMRLWRVAALAAAALALGAILYRAPLGELSGRDHVARIHLQGIIHDDPALRRRLDEIAEDARARALILAIDSPGGSAVGGEALFAALRRVGAAKPVVAVMGAKAASAGYMVAVAADRIFARNATVTGSIGVVLQAPQFVELLDSVGIRVDVLRSGPLKAVPNPVERLTRAGRAANQQVVDEVFDMFVDMVSERRALTRAEVLALADGRIYTGRTAVENGLVDAIGGEGAARDWLAAEHGVDLALDARDRDPDARESWFDRRLRALFGESLLPGRLALDGLVALWHPSI